ncbi:MAG: hypothetical protein U9Q37_06310 [Euryarchaeota archaeon]|uniref:Uncharacterized protein n=1 Tax=Candidatus Methanogaster sp. TaxID=3386292 RepID=A0AC61L2U9_9EURY|nr:hypothetical protein [Euryarchaeota archaeon]PXF60613.1 MAG: hypothetical protein C4B59_08840 [ANME-2 cluster archaeon]
MVKETEERIYGMPMVFARKIGRVGVSAAVTTANPLTSSGRVSDTPDGTANVRVAEELAQLDPSAIFPGGRWQ